MPIYEYICGDCDARYERVVLSREQAITCPQCGSGRRILQPSVFRTPGKSSGSASDSSHTGSACGCTPKTCGCH